MLLEESFYWRGMARQALGDTPGAIEDLKKSIELNPHFAPGIAQLEFLKP